MRVRWVAAVVALMPMLGGCTTVALSVVEEAASGFIGEECSVRNLLSGSGRLCRDAAPAAPAPAVFCHRTLGSVECYGERDPRSPATGIAVGDPAPSAPALAEPEAPDRPASPQPPVMSELQLDRS